MQDFNTSGGFGFQTQWENIPNNVRRIVTVDVGYRNLGLCMYNVEKDEMEMLEWIDVARHPDSKTPTNHDVAGRIVSILKGLPNFNQIDLWVVEQQPVKANKSTQPMNLIVEGAIQGMCEMAGVSYLLFDPMAIKQSLCPHIFAEGNYDDNKEQARQLCGLLMRPREMMAIVIACARQHVFAQNYTKRYKLEFDDMADAFIMAMLVCVRLQKRNVFRERMPATASEYDEKINNFFDQLRAPVPIDIQYSAECIDYEKYPFEVRLPHNGDARPANIAHLRRKLFVEVSDDQIQHLLRGEDTVEESRMRKMTDGNFKSTNKERKRGVSRTHQQFLRASKKAKPEE